MTALRTVLEIATGLLYAAGALFNLVYTRSHTEEFYGSFADGAWLAPARRLVRDLLLPNATIFTLLLIVFQVAIAVMILSRGDLVRPALLVGAAFAFVAALASNVGGTIGNLALAVLQLVLALAG